MTANNDFQQLVRPGVLIRFKGDNGATFQARVRSCNWLREYVTVHIPIVANPQKVPAYAIQDVVFDRSDIDSVEEWLEQPPVRNPYVRPLRGPMASFYMAPDGKVTMIGNTDQSAPAQPDALLRRAQELGMFDRSNRNYVGAAPLTEAAVLRGVNPA